VSTGEAAEVLEVPMRELYRMIDRGEVPARRCARTLEVFPWGNRRRLRLVR
jgi:excisionase family DNA binding protein